VFEVDHGLAVLGPEALQVQAALDAVFCEWAAACGAAPHQYAPLYRVEDLASLDYFVNFPHLTLLAAPLAEQRHAGYAAGEGTDVIPARDLAQAGYALPSAACYGAYLHLRGRSFERPVRVTTVARCFRNEAEYRGLERLWGFQMREIICLGDRATVQNHLADFKSKTLAFAAALDLPVATQVAHDPFFDSKASRSAAALIFPVKEEFVYRGSLAIGSVNFHRNFFGERCALRGPDGAFLFSGCAAFGLERWLHALVERHGDAGRICAAIAGAQRALALPVAS
jgi:seryl-tRNA synthetase